MSPFSKIEMSPEQSNPQAKKRNVCKLRRNPYTVVISQSNGDRPGLVHHRHRHCRGKSPPASRHSVGDRTDSAPLSSPARVPVLDAVLGDLAALAVPDQCVRGRFDAVAGDDVVAWLVVKQFGLPLVPDHDQAERLVSVAFEGAQVFERASATGEHQHQRFHVERCHVAAPAAGLGHLLFQPSRKTQTL